MDKKVTDYFDGVIITAPMDDLPLSEEAKIFYQSRCWNQKELINKQHEEGIDIPKIKMSKMNISKYRKSYDISEEKMNSIIDEFKKVDVIDITD